MKKIFVFVFCVCILASSVLSYAEDGEYVYDISEQTGISMEIVEKIVNNFCEDRKKTDSEFSVSEWYLDKAYLIKPLKYYLMITAYKDGMKLSDMTAGYGRLILPIENKDGKMGKITFKCENSHLSYIGMGVAQNYEEISLLDVDKVIKACTGEGIKITDMDIYINDMYHLLMAEVSDGNEQYIIPYSFDMYSEYGLDDYKVYAEKEFWNKMDAIFDEDANNPEENGGVPFRTDKEAGQGKMLYVYLAAAFAAFAGAAFCVYKVKKRKKS
ncbi:MAG: hypothetical protein K6F92_03255 [Lachnospiraceae bacterium]|nr:hypothetical protein [Lachnospiraceae bacterium]